VTARGARTVLLPLAGGALIGCSLPPVAPWPVGVLGAGTVVAALSNRPWHGRFGAGLLAGLGQFSIGLAWAIQFSDAGYAALVIVESLIVAVVVVIVPPSGPLRIPAAAGALALAEWVRQTWPFGGLPLGSAALGQVGGPLQFVAPLGGSLLIVFALALAGGGVTDLVGAVASRLRAKAASRSRVAGAICVLAAAALAGAGTLSTAGLTASGPSDKKLEVALVQGGGRRGLSELQVPASTVLAAAVRETKQVRGHPRLIVWPEDVVAMGNTSFVGSPTERLLAGIARSHRATFVAGVTQDVGSSRFLNEVVAFSPKGKLVATFEKVHRVPFGEYVPYRSFFKHFANLAAVPRDAIPGTGSGMIATPAGRLAVLISYEVFFSARGRSGVRAGGELIVVPTNTSSYSNDQAPAQEIAASRMQALEEDRDVVQVAPTGYSAFVTASGVVLQRSSLSQPAVLEGEVTLSSATTPFADAGDLPVLIGSLVLLAAGWLACTRRRPGKPGGDAAAGASPSHRSHAPPEPVEPVEPVDPLEQSEAR
jgi:apolipoprotein N-acyltransferase